MWATCISRPPRRHGYIRVDWFTPAGLPTWGDGRLTILGTEGYIELRKYIDIAGRPGERPSVPRQRRRAAAISTAPSTELPFGRQFLDDVRNRTETAMPQERCFNAMKLALTAQQMAERGTEWAAMSRIFNVAVIGVGIGRSHIVEGYAAQCRQVQGAGAVRSQCRAHEPDRRRIRRSAARHQFRRRAGDGRYRHHRYLHPAGRALFHGDGGAAGRQARDLRKAAGRLAGPGRRGHRRRRKSPRAC